MLYNLNIAVKFTDKTGSCGCQKFTVKKYRDDVSSLFITVYFIK